jgi:hypothetical protein
VIPIPVVAERQDLQPRVDATDPTFELRSEPRAVALPPTGVLVPESCACCAAPAAASLVERQLVGDGSLIVPYCRECHRHAAATSTRTLATTLASSLLALALAAGLPIAFPWMTLGTLFGLALIGSLVPLGVVSRRSAARAPHTSRGRAVWWKRSGDVVCASSSWGQSLAELNGAGIRPVAEREPRFSAWMLAGPMLGLAAVPFLDWLHHPLVRVVNLTETEIVVSVDGHTVAEVWPTSVEHPEAGAETRIPAGRRVIQVHDRGGHLLAQDSVLVRSGRQHLYAPGDHDYCFWIETVGYGQSGPETPRIQRLEGPRHFWVLPTGIDTWFGRTPGNPEDTRASGGTLTALRQARCSEALGQD